MAVFNFSRSTFLGFNNFALNNAQRLRIPAQLLQDRHRQWTWPRQIAFCLIYSCLELIAYFSDLTGRYGFEGVNDFRLYVL